MNNLNKEFEKFNLNANQWWIKSGNYSILHKINNIRIKYIVKQILKNRDIKIAKKYPLKNIDIIDLGCGGGLVCEPLYKLGGNITGVDFIKKNIETAKKHAKKENLDIKYKFGEVNNLGLKKKYDVMLFLEIIEHLKDWKKTIKKIEGNIKPDGLLIFSTINRNVISKFLALFVAENILQWVPRGTHEYQKLIKPKELVKILVKNNYEITDLTGLIYNPINGKWKLSKKNTLVNYFCCARKIS